MTSIKVLGVNICIESIEKQSAYMTRSEAREWCMKLIYQLSIQNNFKCDEIESFIEYFDLPSSEVKYIRKNCKSIIDNLDNIDNIIKENLEGCWNYNRIAKIDLAILRVAVNEIYYLDEIPESVAINEAIEIANKYSTDASYKFINGILGTIVRAKK